MREVLLVRFGEVHLKGQNRPYFLKTLTENVRRAVKPLGGQVWLADSRIYVDGVEDMRACGERVRRVFGVYSVSPAWELPKEFEYVVNYKDLGKAYKMSFFPGVERVDDRTNRLVSSDYMDIVTAHSFIVLPGARPQT